MSNVKYVDEKEAFNARVEKDEMVITMHEFSKMEDTIEKYEKMTKEMNSHIQYLEECCKKHSEEKQKILSEMELVNKENRKLKQGIISFVKGFGG